MVPMFAFFYFDIIFSPRVPHRLSNEKTFVGKPGNFSESLGFLADKNILKSCTALQSHTNHENSQKNYENRLKLPNLGIFLDI